MGTAIHGPTNCLVGPAPSHMGYSPEFGAWRDPVGSVLPSALDCPGLQGLNRVRTMKKRYYMTVLLAWVLWGSQTDLKTWKKTNTDAPMHAIEGYELKAECEEAISIKLKIWINEYRGPGYGGATDPIGNGIIVYDKPNDAENGKIVNFECWPSDFDPRGKRP